MDADKLRAALRKQKVVIQDNDPVLDVVAICDAALAEAVEAAGQAAQQAADQVARAVAENAVDAKVLSERVISDAAEWLVERLQAAGAEVAASIIHETQAEVARAEQARAIAVRSAWVAGGISVAGVAAMAALMLWVA